MKDKFFSVAGDLQGEGDVITEIPKRSDIVLEAMPLSSKDEPPKFGRMKRFSDTASIDSTTKEVIESKEEKAKFGRLKPTSISESTYKTEDYSRATLSDKESVESVTDMFDYTDTKEDSYIEVKVEEEHEHVKFSENNRALLKDSSDVKDRKLMIEEMDVKTKERKLSSNIYFVDFILGFGRKENIPMLIYLVMNVLLIAGVIMFISSGMISFWLCLLVGLLLYTASVTIALSPIGEAVLRHQNGCMKIRDRKTVDRLLPIFQEVKEKARKLYPNISDDIRLYICEEESPNAFATGRRTICMTEGLLELSDDEIKATLGHEFGHLAHKDTDRILVISIGNLFVTGFCMVIQGIILFFQIIFTIADSRYSESMSDAILKAVYHALIKTILFFIINLIMRAWTGIGCLLCMKTSRDCEYLADEFSVRMGYGTYLCAVLDKAGDVRLKGLFANLSKSHPDSEDRIDRIIDLMEGVE